MATPKPAAEKTEPKKKRERKSNPARVLAAKFADAAAAEADCKSKIAKLQKQLAQASEEHGKLLALKNGAFAELKSFGAVEG